MTKRYTVEIELANGKNIKWINGGVGYTKQELDRVYKKLVNDNRVTDITVKEV